MPSYIQEARTLIPNEAQWAAYQAKGNCVLLAGPGSGKTKTLTLKLAKMLHEDVLAPRGIACITYSTECARELTKRLSALGIRSSNNLYIGTVHSFCHSKIIVPFAKLAGLTLPAPLSLANTEFQEQTFRKVLLEISGTTDRWMNHMKDMNLHRVTCIDRDSDKWQKAIFLSSLATSYETSLRESGYIDYNDQILLGCNLIDQNPWVRRLIEARFPIIVVDEYQDLGIPLDRIIRRLCLDSGVRLFAVGDPDQSIYGFTGADPTLLENLSKQPGIEAIRLKTNYRSAQTIVKLAEVALQVERGYTTVTTAPQGSIYAYHCPEGIRHQADYICREIIPKVTGKGFGLEQIAILYPTKDEGDVIAQAAASQSLPIIRVDKNAPYEKNPFTRWLEDCAAWCAGGWTTSNPKLSTILQNWNFINKTPTYGQKFSQNTEELSNFLWDSRNGDEPLVNWLRAFGDRCLMPLFNRQPELTEEKRIFDGILRMSSAGGRMSGFTVSLFGGQRGAAGHLNLLTLHSSKGLEFEVVFLMGMDQGRFPWNNLTPKILAEQRRLFYVGITRAKKHLRFAYSGWFEDRYGERQYNGPSRFLRELSDHLQLPRQQN